MDIIKVTPNKVDTYNSNTKYTKHNNNKTVDILPPTQNTVTFYQQHKTKLYTITTTQNNSNTKQSALYKVTQHIVDTKTVTQNIVDTNNSNTIQSGHYNTRQSGHYNSNKIKWMLKKCL